MIRALLNVLSFWFHCQKELWKCSVQRQQELVNVREKQLVGGEGTRSSALLECMNLPMEDLI